MWETLLHPTPRRTGEGLFGWLRRRWVQARTLSAQGFLVHCRDCREVLNTRDWSYCLPMTGGVCVYGWVCLCGTRTNFLFGIAPVPVLTTWGLEPPSGGKENSK